LYCGAYIISKGEENFGNNVEQARLILEKLHKRYQTIAHSRAGWAFFDFGVLVQWQNRVGFESPCCVVFFLRFFPWHQNNKDKALNHRTLMKLTEYIQQKLRIGRIFPC
jgi:hypothetical protein